MKKTSYVSWKPRNGTILKPEISKLFKSKGMRLNKTLRVNLLSPLQIKSVCLENKWCALCSIPSKTPLLKELAGAWINQTPPTWIIFHWCWLALFGNSCSGKYQRAFQMPLSIANKSVILMATCHSTVKSHWQYDRNTRHRSMVSLRW